MVCLAVWMAAAAKDISGKVLVIWMQEKYHKSG